jgi:predicted transcriptional regulator
MSRGSFMAGRSLRLAMRALYGAAGAAAQRLFCAVHFKPRPAIMQMMCKRRPADAANVPLDEKTREAIREGLEQAERGEFVSDDVVKDSNKHHCI